MRIENGNKNSYQFGLHNKIVSDFTFNLHRIIQPVLNVIGLRDWTFP